MEPRTLPFFRALLQILPLLLVTGLTPAWGTSSQSEEPGTTTVLQQRYVLDPNVGAEFELMVIEGDSYEDLLSTYRRETLQQNPSIRDPFDQISVSGFVTDEASARAIERALPRSIPSDLRNYQIWTGGKRALQTGQTSLSDRRPAFASDESTRWTRADLLKHFDEIRPQIENRMAALNSAGDEIVSARFKKSIQRKTLIGIRTFLVGAGSAAGMMLSNAEPAVVYSMFVNGAVNGFSIQMGLDWLRHQYTYVQGWEKKLVNVFLHPFGYHWQPKEGTHASYMASQTKWYLSEVAVNEGHKLWGLATYAALRNGESPVPGESLIPHEFRLGQGFEDAVGIGIHTVATQGVFEKVFNDEYALRTTPIHALAAHYAEIARETSDPAMRIRAEGIVEACIRQGIHERVYAGSLANLGSLSWIMALSLQNPTASKIASYSLLAPAAGLKAYFQYRRKKEDLALGRVGNATQREAVGKMITNQCRSMISGVRDWARQWAGEVVRYDPKSAR